MLLTLLLRNEYFNLAQSIDFSLRTNLMVQEEILLDRI